MALATAKPAAHAARLDHDSVEESEDMRDDVLETSVGSCRSTWTLISQFAGNEQGPGPSRCAFWPPTLSWPSGR